MSKDIDWILTEPVGVAAIEDHYLVVERGGKNRTCVISYRDGRMLFDSQDIETEAFMAYVGLLDAVNESPHKRVLFEGETDMKEL